MYYSFPTTLFMNLPYGGVMVATNETLKSYFNPSGGQDVPAFLTRLVTYNERTLVSWNVRNCAPDALCFCWGQGYVVVVVV